MAIVYRVESKTNKSESLPIVNQGAYRCGLADLLCSSYGSGEIHPSPYSDMKLSRKWKALGCNSLDYAFCFDSLEALNRWFDIREAREIHEDEGRIAIYQCPDSSFIQGSFQCIAKASDLRLLEVQPLTYRM